MLGYYHHGTGWGGWLVMALSMVAFWGLVVWAVIVIFRADPANSTPDKRDPHRLLDERFARGDIDEPEYRQRQAILRTSAPAGSVPPPVATPRRH